MYCSIEFCDNDPYGITIRFKDRIPEQKGGGRGTFDNPDPKYPLVEALFAIKSVYEVYIGDTKIYIFKKSNTPWSEVKKEIFAAIEANLLKEVEVLIWEQQ